MKKYNNIVKGLTKMITKLNDLAKFNQMTSKNVLNESSKLKFRSDDLLTEAKKALTTADKISNLLG